MTGAAYPDGGGALYRCRVRHVRRADLAHTFEYGNYYWLVDLDALAAAPARFGPLARFRTADHLSGAGPTLRAGLDAYLAANGRPAPTGRVLMLAQARVLGSVFNPLTVYWCFDADGAPGCVVAEVHNTYGERHAYLLDPDENAKAFADKVFYVSPFFDVSGRYELRLPVPGERLALSITLRRDTPDGPRTAFTATVTGRRRPATAAELLRCLLRYPPGGLRTQALIRYEGVRLFLRRLPVQRKPAPPPPIKGVPPHPSPGA